jgi:uncharacterized protein YndB with AHSA1/START domain
LFCIVLAIMSLLTQTVLPADQPLIITARVIAAPRDLVWKILTTPEHLLHFWGPDGFTNTFKTFDLQVGKEARFTMHGPDGRNWPNRFVFLAIDAPRLLRWNHDNGGEGESDHKFSNEIELTEEAGKTRIEMRMTESSIAARDAVAQFAVEGGKQNLDRLAAYVAPMADEKNLFVIERSFPVSQERLFRACTDAKEMAQWFAPPGMTTIKSEQDLKPGGTYHYGLSSGQGNEMWGLVTYKEITPSSRLVYRQSFSDPQGGLTRHPMAPTWPMEMLTIMDFIPEGEKQTRLKISWIYAGIDDAEGETFRNAHAGMNGGWTGTLDGLYAYLTNNP